MADDAGTGSGNGAADSPLQARLDVVRAGPHVEVLVPRTGLPGAGFSRAHRSVLADLIGDWLSRERIHRPVAWLGTPMAWPLARALQPSRVVYDCADELAGFLGAPPELGPLEDELLRTAHLVIAATPALAVSRSRRAGADGRVLLLPNGVAAEFLAVRRADDRRATAPRGWDADEAARHALPVQGPQLGFAGVVDERMDLGLLAALADARPEWQIVLAGPVLKIDPATLPRRANLHWLGPLPHRLLPELMSGWQLALVPFVDSAVTRDAVPLKMLEALAAGLPVVTPPLPGLEPWRTAGVACAADAAGFVAACESALGESADRRAARQSAARRMLRGSDWRGLARSLDRALRIVVTSAG